MGITRRTRISLCASQNRECRGFQPLSIPLPRIQSKRHHRKRRSTTPLPFLASTFLLLSVCNYDASIQSTPLPCVRLLRARIPRVEVPPRVEVLRSFFQGLRPETPFGFHFLIFSRIVSTLKIISKNVPFALVFSVGEELQRKRQFAKKRNS